MVLCVDHDGKVLTVEISKTSNTELEAVGESLDNTEVLLLHSWHGDVGCGEGICCDIFYEWASACFKSQNQKAISLSEISSIWHSLFEFFFWKEKRYVVMFLVEYFTCVVE